MATYIERHKLWEEEVRNMTEQAKKEKAKQADATPSEFEENDKNLRPINDTLPGEDGPANLKVGTASGQASYDLRSENDKVTSVHKRSAEDASDSILERNRKTMETNELVKKIGEELDFNTPSSSTGHHNYGAADNSQTLLTDELELPYEPVRPQTHDEYVKERILNDHIPPGFVSLNDKRYILRYVSAVPLPPTPH
jgi:mannosyl-oligosaccharide alpha-1,2-mannosidase